MLVTEKAQWIYLAKVKLTQLVEAYKLRSANILTVCIEVLESASTTEAQAEKVLTYIVQQYCLDELPVPVIIPNIPNLPLPTFGAGKDGRGITNAQITNGDLILTYDQAPFSQNVGQVVADAQFPIGTPNVNVAVGGWFAGYVLAGKEVIDALIDLGVQFINPSTTISLTSLVQSTSLVVSGNNIERGAIITAININRVRNLGSDTFVSGLYTQPNVANVNDNEGAPNARSFTGISITANNTAISGGIPIHTLTLVTDYGTSPNETDTLNINFISPVYFGVLALANAGTPANIQALGKASLANNQLRTGLSFSPTTLSPRPIYAYPSRFPPLTSITDNFGNQLIGAFTNSVIPNFTFGGNAPNEDYRVYVYTSDVSPSTILFNFNA